MSFLNHPSQMVPAAAGQSRPSLLHRVLDAILHEPQHTQEQVWIDLITQNGGRLSDEIERRIGEHL